MRYLRGQLAGVAGPDVGLEDQADPRGHRSHGVHGPFDDGHHLVPLTFDVREHRVGLVGQAGLAHHPHGCGDGRGDAAGLVTTHRADAEGNNHMVDCARIPRLRQPSAVFPGCRV